MKRAIAIQIVIAVVAVSALLIMLTSRSPAELKRGLDDGGGCVGRECRQLNSYVTDYKPAIARRLDRLVSMEAKGDDAEVVRLARDIIDPPPPAHFGTRLSWPPGVLQSAQSSAVDRLLGQKKNGFFIECGGYDGETLSNTLWLEKQRGWTGLLVEMDPSFYTQIIGKRRHVWSANACLSTSRTIAKLPVKYLQGGFGHIVAAGGQHDAFAPCFPVESFLLALNVTHVDYFSLDAEGADMKILETIPWDRISFSVLSVEAKRDNLPLIHFMESRGYKADVHLDMLNTASRLHAFDYIFVRK